MHVSKPRVISQGLEEQQTIEFSGVKTRIEIHRVATASEGTYNYIAYVIDEVPDWVIALPIEKIVDWVGSGVNPRRAIVRGLKDIGLKPRDEEVDIGMNIFNRWFNHYGAATPLFLMDNITDIYINKIGTKYGYGGIYIEHTTYGRIQTVIGWEPYDVWKGKKIIRTVKFDFNALVDYLIRRVALRTRTAITAYNPVASVVDPEFGVRISVETEPVNPGSISVRVLPKKPWTLVDMVRNGMVAPGVAGLLWLLADYKVPILIVGPMGSGKTSLQNAIAYMLTERTMTLIMDVAELFLPYHKVVVPMFERVAYAQGVRAIGKDELIRQALRSGVDIIVLNEARSPAEFKALAEAITLGHGALTTFHAEDYEAAKVRLASLGLDAERLLDIAVVVEVGMTRDVVRQPDGTYTIVTRRFVRRVYNAVERLRELMRDYGRDRILSELRRRVVFLVQAARSWVGYRELAGLLDTFYKGG